MNQIELEVRKVITEAIKAQIQKPTHAIVNSEAAFVAQRLRNDGYTGVAARYWSWSCGHENREEFGDEIYELQMQLNEIDRGVSMPAWGTYGT